jgi:hypothetical protein
MWKAPSIARGITTRGLPNGLRFSRAAEACQRRAAVSP